MLELAIIAAVIALVAGATGWGDVSIGAGNVRMLALVIVLMVSVVTMMLLVLGVPVGR